MDTEKCAALLCAIEKGNLTDAAQELGYTPSGISRMMAALEKEVGMTLLRRSRNGITPTRSCQDLLPTIRELARLGKQLQTESAALNGVLTGELQVATAYSVFYQPLSDLVRQFSAQYPGVRIGIREGRSSLLMKELEAGQVDFCVISKRNGHCNWIPLFEDEMRAWVQPTHPAAQKGVYSLKDLETDPYIQFYPGEETDSALVCRQHGIVPNRRYMTSDPFAAYQMVEAGLGVTFLNGLFDGLWSGTVVSLPLNPPVKIPIGIAVTEGQHISPAAKRFRDFAVEHSIEHLRSVTYEKDRNR